MRAYGDNGGMRVIAGKFRSRTLTAPRGAATRPTSDRLRETLFNILAPRMEGARFVDLYAGTGAMGIEALSRGAAQVWLAEKEEPALKSIRANLKALGIVAGVEIEVRGVGALLERLAKAGERAGAAAESAGQSRTSGAIDIVYLDPPWEAEAEYARTLEFLGGARGRAMLAVDAIVIAEHGSKKQLAERYGSLCRTRELKQGDAALSFYAMA
jgi:16S rRNA (guanine966-N2)-methyltransferase